MSDTVSLPSTDPSAGADTLNVSVLSVESRVITLFATSLPPNVRSELVEPSAFFGVIIILTLLLSEYPDGSAKEIS